MKRTLAYYQELYLHFNEQYIEPVIESIVADINWAREIKGAVVNGPEAIKEYWLRRFNIIQERVTPLAVVGYDDRDIVEVRQVITDTGGNIIANQIVYHHFIYLNGKLADLHIENLS